MSGQSQDVTVQPLVIVRRRRGTEESHHGGVWKIAYADFMTAMMAFFLVMWLINAADRQTIVQVAAYFNPMRLTDRTEVTKGLQNQNETDSKVDEKQEGKNASKSEDETKAEHIKTDKAEIGPTAVSPAGASKEQAREHAMFVDPMAALNVLASKAKPKRMARSAGEAARTPRDPFDPATRLTEIPSPITKPIDVKKPVQKPIDGKFLPGQAIAEKPSEKSDAKPESANSDVKVEEVKQLAEAIKAAASQAADKLPEIEVKGTPEGILVSLTDDANFGMFEIGSARPRPELVVIIEKIAETLKTHEGQVVVRGHTDGRPYTNGIYDNWRLSSARAQMAHYMLVRGGLEESRFLGVEGRADRDLKVSNDPNAAENRRIEILLKKAER